MLNEAWRNEASLVLVNCELWIVQSRWASFINLTGVRLQVPHNVMTEIRLNNIVCSFCLDAHTGRSEWISLSIFISAQFFRNSQNLPKTSRTQLLTAFDLHNGQVRPSGLREPQASQLIIAFSLTKAPERSRRAGLSRPLFWSHLFTTESRRDPERTESVVYCTAGRNRLRSKNFITSTGATTLGVVQWRSLSPDSRDFSAPVFSPFTSFRSFQSFGRSDS